MVLGRFGWVWVAPYFNKCALQRQTKRLKIAPSSPSIQAKAFVVQGLVPPFFKQTRSSPQVCTDTWHDVVSKMGPYDYKVNYFQNPFKLLLAMYPRLLHSSLMIFFPKKEFNMQICSMNWMVTKSFVSLSEELKGESAQMTNSSLICYYLTLKNRMKKIIANFIPFVFNSKWSFDVGKTWQQWQWIGK